MRLTRTDNEQIELNWTSETYAGSLRSLLSSVLIVIGSGGTSSKGQTSIVCTESLTLEQIEIE